MLLNRIINGRLFKFSTIPDEYKSNKNPTKFSVHGYHIFFGYYDISPFSKDGKRLLSIKTNNSTKIPASVGYFYLDNPEVFISVGKTETWCWQQGSRLRWFGKESNKYISYNSIKNDNYINIIQNIETCKIEKRISASLYDINQVGTLGLSLNFSRLQRLRPGYGYSNIDDHSKNYNCPSNDGIFLVDITNNKLELIISYSDLNASYPIYDEFNTPEHYFNHLSFNPSGDKFIFFHIVQHNSGRYIRLFVYDLSTKETKIIEDELIVSHYTWKNDRELLITAINNQGFTCYKLYNIDTNLSYIMNNQLLNKDGHPSFIHNKDGIISDTYPDKCNEQELFYYDIKLKKYRMIGKFYKRYKYIGESRCDLHPRLNYNSTLISFDSTHYGIRAQYVMELPDPPIYNLLSV